MNQPAFTAKPTAEITGKAIVVPAGARRLYLSENPALIREQLAGHALTRLSAGPLRDDISTDEITPVAILSHYDQTLGEFAHTGFRAGGEAPIGRRRLRESGFVVLVGAKRYGKGSSREHSPAAEKLAGVRVVFAESFERLYRQNADNLGLFTSTNFALLERLENGESLTVSDLISGREPLAAEVLSAGGLLAWGQRKLRRPDLHKSDPPPPAPPGSGQTLFEKILSRHLLPTDATPLHPQAGDGVFVRADWRFIHEYYTGMADTLMRQAVGDAVRLESPESIVVFEDHTSYLDESPAHRADGLVPNMMAMIRAQRDFVERHGLLCHQTPTEAQAMAEANADVTVGIAKGFANGARSAGISHAMMAEHYALPGQVVVGTDSHTPHSGALGCVAFGVGTTDMANAFLTGAVRVTWPESVKVEMTGSWPPGVMAKDAVLHLLSTPYIRSGGGIGKVFEFTGAAVAALSIDERATLTNMCAELGGLTGIVAPDLQTVRFLAERRGQAMASAPWMQSDADARWSATLGLDVSTLSPMVSRPGDPGRALPLSSLTEKVRIDIAYGGSCTAGKREDFDHYHAVLHWGLTHGQPLAPGVQVFLQYGTTAVRDYCRAQGYDQTFAAMGVRILQPSCGACANCGPGVSTDAAQVTVSAINRNFPGRSGPGQVWLASPPTVMASALAGELMSWEALQRKVTSATRDTRFRPSR